MKDGHWGFGLHGCSNLDVGQLSGMSWGSLMQQYATILFWKLQKSKGRAYTRSMFISCCNLYQFHWFRGVCRNVLEIHRDTCDAWEATWTARSSVGICRCTSTSGVTVVDVVDGVTPDAIMKLSSPGASTTAHSHDLPWRVWSLAFHIPKM